MIVQESNTKEIMKIVDNKIRKTILHISYDLRPSISTTAVRNLIEVSSKEFDNLSVDLMRVGSPSAEHLIQRDDRYLEINSFGLPFSLFLISNLKRAGHKIFSIIKFNKDIDVIHAHKLTFEGYIGYVYARKFGIPLVITLRQTDFELYKYRPDLRSIFKEIIKYSSKIFYIVPGMKNLLRKQTGEDFYRKFAESKMVYLPNIVEFNHTPDIKNEYKRNELLTVLRMTKGSVKRKNIKRLFIALSGLKRY